MFLNLTSDDETPSNELPAFCCSRLSIPVRWQGVLPLYTKIKMKEKKLYLYIEVNVSIIWHSTGWLFTSFLLTAVLTGLIAASTRPLRAALKMVEAVPTL